MFRQCDKLPDGQSKKQQFIKQFIAKRLILKNLRNATDNPPAKTIKLADGLHISFFIVSLEPFSQACMDPSLK